MNATYACPNCEATNRGDVQATTDRLTCSHCQYSLSIDPPPAADGPLDHCLVCPCQELYIRKDFSQRLGVTIIVIGFILSSIAWYYYQPYWSYAILGATALFDFVLYLRVGNLLQCYRCHAEYRGVAGLDSHEHFSLETHERYRQQVARLNQAASSAPRQ